MDKKIVLWILAITAIVLTTALLLPGGKTPDSKPKLPWLIETGDDGSSRVFEITLGQSTLSEARQVLGTEGKVNIFVSKDGISFLEAYFERLYISGIKADLVFSLSLSNEQLDSIYQRGIRISQLGDGSKKVTIAQDDMPIVATAVVERITYLPAAKLDQELIQHRFGKPDSIIKEPSGIEHWLYPQKGLDIAINPEGKEVFQYVKPTDFGKVTKPLLELKQGGNTH